MAEPDYDDTNVEEAWVLDQRQDVESYLKKQRVRHGEIGEWPGWHVAPIISVWAIESYKYPGTVGWWVVSGDVPTDYVSAEHARHPRAVLRALAKRWEAMAKDMRNGRTSPHVSIGQPSNHAELAPLLEGRAKAFLDFAAQDELWDYDEAEFEG